jgi:hypothetical protein
MPGRRFTGREPPGRDDTPVWLNLLGLRSSFQMPFHLETIQRTPFPIRKIREIMSGGPAPPVYRLVRLEPSAVR